MNNDGGARVRQGYRFFFIRIKRQYEPKAIIRCKKCNMLILFIAKSVI